MLTTVLLVLLGNLPTGMTEDMTQLEMPEISEYQIPYSDTQVLELADRNSYKLGPGDAVSVVVEGGSSQFLTAAGIAPWAQYIVGSDGYLSISGIGAVPVDGLTINEAQDALQRTTYSYFPSIRVTLSLLQPRQLKVTVGGMVDLPGAYVLSALNRVSDAVSVAGGISTFGSRTGTMYTDSGDSIQIDLNMQSGSLTPVSDPFLEDNADVIMDVCQEPIYILGMYNSLETREYRRNEDFPSLMSRMGGIPGNMDLKHTTVLRDGEHMNVWTEEDGFSSLEILAGDTVLVVRVDNTVTVGGAVSTPGVMPYSSERTVLDYVIAAGGPVSTASGSYTVRRNGREVDFETDVEDAILLPGDEVNVNYNWFNRNAALISLVTSAISIGITIYAVNN
ncbi:MAG: hypothetical protein GF388_09275 [Candidatus Aegiribacteria sp.]|nr:hypothetical protein [Candidatus Aegiribacteria sp.]MBD3295248.1 hypothetical protein [Candidatus Fermentibacteria bacterium]